jgi:hypothetical protein
MNREAFTAVIIGFIIGLLFFCCILLISIKQTQIKIETNISNIESYISEFENYEAQK